MAKQNLLIVVFCTGILLVAAIAGYGQGACGKTDYDCQVNFYRDQINKDPKDIEAYYSLSGALQDKGDYAASIAALDTYIAAGTKPEYMADAYNRRGWAQHKLHRDELAVRDYTRAIELFPKAHIYANRGRAYSDLKQYDLAIADDTKAIGLDPKSKSAYFNRGFSYMSQKNYPPAIADFSKTIELDPAEYEAFYNLGTIYYRQKEYRLAIRNLDKYVSMDVGSDRNLADGYINRGLAYYYLDNTANAIADFTKAIDLAPNMKSAYSDRAMAYRKIGKTALAAADEQKAATLGE